MLNFRKLLCKPQVDDWSPLAKFFFADEALNSVAHELDSFDNRRFPDRCQQLVLSLIHISLGKSKNALLISLLVENVNTAHIRDVFDHLFAEFELNYVSTMVPVKSAREYELQLELVVLFSETLLRAKARGYITDEQIETCDPTIMFSLPRLAIVCGLAIYPDGPLDLNRAVESTCEMLQPFRALFKKIRVLLNGLNEEELSTLEIKLSSFSGGDELNVGDDDEDVELYSDFIRKRKECKEKSTKASVNADQCCSSTSSAPENDVATTSSTTTTTNNESSATTDWRQAYRSPKDIIHRLFVCIAGIADQWQSTYPSDLRTVLKMVFHPEEENSFIFEEVGRVASTGGNEEETGVDVAAEPKFGVPWVPDEECDGCSLCEMKFSFIRRRHHCRCCGKIFCGRCTSNTLPLPALGYAKAVRVCDRCFDQQLACVDEFLPA
ncbi:Lateral signaling target protein 2 -like protein [Trichinella pseudospiralis]|uniref:Lateral signaling target protein 2-like protein n=1 Tax=Trichinella pseudospiralis TaxID=6337 RepID=A0A0V0Y4G6_TRIPS|nr:Lateral signaling target protein 2 -like protein [Trichinella pseudospiralis]